MDDEVRALLDRQKRMAEAAERLQTAPDVETLFEWVAQLESEAKELEKRAVAWGKKMEAAYPPKKGIHGYVEVVLTPDQRARIKQETGIVMESVRIDDPSGALNYAMMSASPPDITPIAMEQARSNAFREKAKQEARRSIDTQLSALENQSPEMAENVKKLKTDPRFVELMRFGDNK